MMWNTDFVLPSLMVLAILLSFYIFRPKLPNRLNRAFLVLLFSDILTNFTDVVATWACHEHQSLTIPFVSILNLLFFVAYIFRSYMFLRFTAALVKKNRPGFRWLKYLAWFVLAASEIIVFSCPVTGAVYTVDAAGYHRGPWYGILPVSSFFFLAVGIILLILFRRNIRRGLLIGAFAYHIILIVGNLTRILMPQYLIMNVFSLLALLIIFISSQNPDLYVTDRGSAFNTRAFTEWLEDPQHRRSNKVLGFAIRNYNDQRSMYGGIQMDQGLSMIISWLGKQFPDLLRFYLRGGNFCVAGAEYLDWEKIRERILNRFLMPWRAESTDLYLSVTCVELELFSRTESSDKIVNTLIYALDEAGNSADIEQTLMTEESLREIDHQIEIKRYLDKALENNAVEVYLQPIADSHTRRVIAAEALARLKDEDGQTLSPELFVPIAEKNGQINLLGEQVFRKVCAFIRSHELRSMGLQWINVNLSPIQCMHSELPGLFAAILEEYHVPAEQIHLEITEESTVNYARQGRQIESLLKQGFQLALDDYGAGFSNIHQVKKIAFSSIKLDMKIVWDYVRDRDALLPSLVHAFRQMGFTITAEGIETEEIAEAMTGIGCDYLQGFFFSPPIPAEDFAKQYRLS